MLHAHFIVLCVIDAELLAVQFLYCTEAGICRHPLHVYLFWSYDHDLDHDLDPMTFTYELDSNCLEIHGLCKYELLTESFESYRLTDRDKHTNQPKLYSKWLRGCSNSEK